MRTQVYTPFLQRDDSSRLKITSFNGDASTPAEFFGELIKKEQIENPSFTIEVGDICVGIQYTEAFISARIWYTKQVL